MRIPNYSARRVLLLSLGVSILAGTTGFAPASAIAVLGKKSGSSSFDLPCAEKLEGETAQDETPATVDSAELAPLKLSDTKQPEQPTNTASGASPAAAAPVGTGSTEGTLNASVTENSFMPKGPLEGDNKGLLAPTSVKGSKLAALTSGSSLVEQAKSVNLAPIPLMESSSEAARKADDAAEIEREQLTTLWEATLAKSPDISFVLQKLMPNSDPSKATTVLMRAISSAMYAGVGVMPMMVPNAGAGTFAMQNLGYSTISQLLNITEGSAAKKQRLTQTEQIMLYNMIRNTADKLVIGYRDYKTKHGSLFKANMDFEELKNLAPEVKKDGAKEFEIMYTLKRQQRDIDEIGNELKTRRQFLVDLAGEDAVAKLDGSIDEEFKKQHPEVLASEQQSQQPAEQTSPDPLKEKINALPHSAKVADGPASKFKLPL